MSVGTLDLRPDAGGDRIAVVRAGSITYLPARRVELAPKVASGGLCRSIRRASSGELFVMGPGIGQRVLRSADEGLTWSLGDFTLDVTPFGPEDPGREPWIGAFTILRDDIFLALFMVDDHLPTRRGVIGRSADLGRTWALAPLNPALPAQTRMQAANSDLLQLADGTILLTVDVFNAPGGDPAADPDALPVELQGVFIYALRSADGGGTWPESSCVAMYAGEGHLHQLPSGKLLACVRRQRWHRQPGDPPAPYDLKIASGYRPQFDSEERAGERDEGTNRIKNTYLTESTDGGRTWVEERQVTSFLQCSADLARLGDGTLVLQYLHRYPDDLAYTGIRARVSDDDGATWRDETYVISQGEGDDPNTGSSYPGTIASGPRGVITVCANTVGGRTRLEAVRWQPEGGATA